MKKEEKERLIWWTRWGRFLGENDMMAYLTMMVNRLWNCIER